MYIAPRSRMGKWALGLALVVALFPLYWSVFMLIPDSMRGISIGIAVLIPLVALTSLVLSALAIFRRKDRSGLLTVIAAITLLLVLAFGIGELVAPH
jgi:hypothetical protein